MQRIAITSGDPAGIGPELCLQLASRPKIRQSYVPVLLGDATVFERVAERLGFDVPEIVSDFEQVTAATSPIIFDFGHLSVDDVQPGVVNATTGRAAYEYIDKAIHWAMAKQVAAIVTGPIHKEALRAAGAPYPGHTEMLADKTSAARHCMMLTSEEISCTIVTAHVGLQEVPRLLTPEKILDAIELSHEAMRQMRGRDVRLIVCGLNPHAGEGGLFGHQEEEKVIAPAVAAAKSKGIQVTGPLPPDTAFTATNREKTDCYICMYHDQGLIPLKALAFDTAVNVTLGLPIVRTSVDHGTALDIAWQGRAKSTSFEKAVELAVALATSRE